MSWFDKFRGSQPSKPSPAPQPSGGPPPGRVSRPGDERISTPSADPSAPPARPPAPPTGADFDGPPTEATSKFLNRVEELRAIPGMASRLLQTLDDPSASANAIAQEVQRDQGLMALVLRLANSAAYRSSGQVRDITESIVVLGYDSLKQLVLGRLSRQVLRKNDVWQKALWRHALATALGAQACAREVRGITVAYAFTGGLLHDIGKAVMHEAFPDDCAQVWGGMSGLYSSDHVERTQFGTDHNQIGAELLKQWQFPRMYWQVAGLHARGSKPPEDPKERRLVHIVALAGAVASWCGHDAAPEREGEDPSEHPALMELGAGAPLIELMRAHVDEQLQPLASVFG